MHVVIAHGGDVSRPSGGTNRVSAFAAGLHERGHEVTLVVPEPEESLPERLDGIPVEPVSISSTGVATQPIRAARIAWRAKSVAAQEDAIVQFEHSTLGGVGAMVGCSNYVLDMHDLAFASPLYGDLPFGSFVQRGVRHMEFRGLRNAADIVVVSNRMRDLVRAEWDVSAERFTVIPNGYFESDVAGYRDVEPVQGRVVFLGTLHPKLDTAAIVDIARLPETEEMVIIGDGARADDLSQAKRDHGLDTLHLKGKLPDERAFELVASAAVAINPQHPSRLQEASSPVKLYYYAALGVPMVISAGPEAAERLHDEGAATAVDAERDFAAAVQCVLQDEQRRQAMRDSALRIARGWEWSSRSDDLVRLYQSMKSEINRKDLPSR